MDKDIKMRSGFILYCTGVLSLLVINEIRKNGFLGANPPMNKKHCLNSTAVIRQVFKCRGKLKAVSKTSSKIHKNRQVQCYALNCIRYEQTYKHAV